MHSNAASDRKRLHTRFGHNMADAFSTGGSRREGPSSVWRRRTVKQSSINLNPVLHISNLDKTPSTSNLVQFPRTSNLLQVPRILNLIQITSTSFSRRLCLMVSKSSRPSCHIVKYSAGDATSTNLNTTEAKGTKKVSLITNSVPLSDASKGVYCNPPCFPPAPRSCQYLRKLP